MGAIEGIKLLFPTEANAVFADVPVPVQDALRAKGWRFYTFIGEGGVRLMCSWRSTQARVDAFVRDTQELMKELAD